MNKCLLFSDPLPPVKLTLKSKTTTTAEYQWKINPTSVVDNWNLRYLSLSDKFPYDSGILPIDKMSHTLENLMPGAKYEVEVWSVSKLVRSTSSAKLSVQLSKYIFCFLFFCFSSNVEEGLFMKHIDYN